MRVVEIDKRTLLRSLLKCIHPPRDGIPRCVAAVGTLSEDFRLITRTAVSCWVGRGKVQHKVARGNNAHCLSYTSVLTSGTVTSLFRGLKVFFFIRRGGFRHKFACSSVSYTLLGKPFIPFPSITPLLNKCNNMLIVLNDVFIFFMKLL